MSKYFKAFELADNSTEVSRWINDDIKPIEEGRRKWSFWTFHNYWVLVNSNISTYITGSSLVALGLTWWQAIIAIVIGNLLATGYVVLNSIPGAYYHIGYPIVNRYVWGMYGSAFAIYNRILLSIIWYGFQAWIGGECIYVCLMAMSPDIEKHIPNHMPESTGMTTAQFLAYVLFMLLSLPFVYIHPYKLKFFFWVAAAVNLVFEFILLIWALATMGPEGFGPTISDKSFVKGSSTGWAIAYGITSTIGSISAGILNQNDYARFARKPKDAILGQVFSFPFYCIVCCVIGILVTAATQNRYGEAYWNLPDLFVAMIQTGGPKSRVAAWFSGAALAISQIGVNVPGNALSGGFDFAATFPKYINIRRGAYVTVLLSIAVNPWKLVNTATTFLAVLGSYSVFLGPMTGLMISSYYIVNKRKINVDDLFVGNKRSIYWYTYGINWRAVVAWCCAVAPHMPGFVAAINTSIVVPDALMHLYYISYLSGSVIASVLYCGLHYIFPAQSISTFVQEAGSPALLMQESQAYWDDTQIVAVEGIDGSDAKAQEVLEVKKIEA